MECTVISVNIYKSVETLECQLETIKKHVKNYIVILNCNKYIFDILQDKKLEDNIHINPEIIEKSRFHGSLTRGIVSNMKYALENFKFSYFIILSGRTIFYRDLDIEKFRIRSSVKETDSPSPLWHGFAEDGPHYNSWHWPSLIHTKLARYYLSLNYSLVSSAHEGLCFSYNVVKNIVKFLENNSEIADDLYNFNLCVEEFALQTISQNECDVNNMECGFVYIGNRSDECDQNNLDLYARKIEFLT